MKMAPEEIKALLATPEVDHSGLVRVQGQAKVAQQRSCLLPGLLSLVAVLAQHDEVSSGRGSHPPALAEPDVNLSAHPAPIVQPSGRTPTFQCAKRRGARRATLANHSTVLV